MSDYNEPEDSSLRRLQPDALQELYFERLSNVQTSVTGIASDVNNMSTVVTTMAANLENTGKTQADHELRIRDNEKFKSRAIGGLTGIVTLSGIAWTLVWSKITGST